MIKRTKVNHHHYQIHAGVKQTSHDLDNHPAASIFVKKKQSFCFVVLLRTSKGGFFDVFMFHIRKMPCSLSEICHFFPLK